MLTTIYQLNNNKYWTTAITYFPQPIWLVVVKMKIKYVNMKKMVKFIRQGDYPDILEADCLKEDFL